jgi:excisionase family DNA binding protein
MEKEFFTTSEVAKILGISRIAVFKQIKNGKIKAIKVGRNFVIRRKDLSGISGESLSQKDKKEIEAAVKKIVREYGETLKLLGQE